MALRQVVYASHERFPFEGLALVSLLSHARARNAAQGITGVLLYANGAFVQCLEGPSAAVDALFARIERDPRHGDVVLLHALPVARRHFGAWWMGCARVHDFRVLARIRDEWDAAIGALDRDAALSPGFVLMKTIWEDYARAGLIDRP
ncbi:MAG: BLUF domain-containing protein [Xanthomonadales bacterium]|nr:BLUF domain-containing protein [Xanthomonadales bacterium]